MIIHHHRLWIIMLFLWAFQGCQSLPLEVFQPPKSFTITIEGAITQPGQYEIRPFSTIREALMLVELLDDSDLSSLNLNIILHHHDKLTIPFKTETPCININHATIIQLMQLDQVGEVIAQRIIVHREQNGLFQTVDQITLVKGIGERTLERNRDRLCI